MTVSLEAPRGPSRGFVLENSDAGFHLVVTHTTCCQYPPQIRVSRRLHSLVDSNMSFYAQRFARPAAQIGEI